MSPYRFSGYEMPAFSRTRAVVHGKQALCRGCFAEKHLESR